MTLFIHDTWSEDWVSLDERPLLDPEPIAQLWRCLNTKLITMDESVIGPYTYGLFKPILEAFPDGTDPDNVQVKKSIKTGMQNLAQITAFFKNNILKSVTIDGHVYVWASGTELDYTLVESIDIEPSTYSYIKEKMHDLITSIRAFCYSLDMLVSIDESLRVSVTRKHKYRETTIGIIPPEDTTPNQYLGHAKDTDITCAAGYMAFKNWYYHTQLESPNNVTFGWGNEVEGDTTTYDTTLDAAIMCNASTYRNYYYDTYGIWYRCIDWAITDRYGYRLDGVTRRQYLPEYGMGVGGYKDAMIYTYEVIIEAIGWPSGITVDIKVNGTIVDTLSTGETITLTFPDPDITPVSVGASLYHVDKPYIHNQGYVSSPLVWNYSEDENIGVCTIWSAMHEPIYARQLQASPVLSFPYYTPNIVFTRPENTIEERHITL